MQALYDVTPLSLLKSIISFHFSIDQSIRYEKTSSNKAFQQMTKLKITRGHETTCAQLNQQSN